MMIEDKNNIELYSKFSKKFLLPKKILPMKDLCKSLNLFAFFFILLSFVLGFNSSAFAQSGIERIQLDNYPEVRILFKEGKGKRIQNQTVSLTESSSSLIREVQRITVIRKEDLRPVYVLITIQASTWENNKYVKQVGESLLNSFTDKDKFGIQIYSQANSVLEFGLNKDMALEKLKELNLGEGNKIFENINSLYMQIPESDIPIIHIVLSPEDATDESNPNSVIYGKAKKLNVFTIIIGKENRTNLFLSSATNGKFYPIFDPNIIGHIQNSIYQIQKYPPILEYTTPFTGFWDSVPSRNVKVRLEVGKDSYEAEYEVNPIVIIKGFFSDVEFFIGLFLGLLFFFLLISYALYQRKRRLQWEEYVRKQEEIRKSDLYYHENKSYEANSNRGKIIKTQEMDEEDWKRFEEEELEMDQDEDFDLDISNEEEISEEVEAETLPAGQIYTKVFFIQKEGPNPGRQFVVHEDEINIGRSPENQLVLLDSTVSLKHAKIKKVNGIYYIYDLVSERGVYINGKKLLKPRPLFDFDEVRLGKIMLLFRGN